MKACRLWIILFLLTALICGALIQVIRRQRLDLAEAYADRALVIQVNNDMMEATHSVMMENQALAAEALKHPARDFRDF